MVDLEDMLEQVTVPHGMKFAVVDEGGKTVLQIRCRSRDSRNPKRWIEVVHPTVVPSEAYISRTHMLAFIRFCLQQLALHEVDEWFRYRGVLVHDPHSRYGPPIPVFEPASEQIDTV